MILLEDVSHAKAMDYMNYIIGNMGDDIVEVVFRKKNDRVIRRMKVHFNKDFIEKTVKGSTAPEILAIKKTNELRDNMVVCELTKNGTYQFRTIPLRKIIGMKVYDGKTKRFKEQY